MIIKSVTDQILPLVQNNVTADWIRYSKFTYLKSLKKIVYLNAVKVQSNRAECLTPKLDVHTFR